MPGFRRELPFMMTPATGRGRPDVAQGAAAICRWDVTRRDPPTTDVDPVCEDLFAATRIQLSHFPARFLSKVVEASPLIFEPARPWRRSRISRLNSEVRPLAPLNGRCDKASSGDRYASPSDGSASARQWPWPGAIACRIRTVPHQAAAGAARLHGPRGDRLTDNIPRRTTGEAGDPRSGPWTVGSHDKTKDGGTIGQNGGEPRRGVAKSSTKP
jgi:hypothetical protein